MSLYLMMMIVLLCNDLLSLINMYTLQLCVHHIPTRTSADFASLREDPTNSQPDSGGEIRM